MAHEVESMAWIERVPWHGLGVKVEKGTPMSEFIAAAGLDWELIPHEVAIKVGDGEYEEYSNRIAWVRSTDRKQMVMASREWRPLQNKQAIGMMDEWVRAGGLTLDTMGSLKGGKVVWALARLNDGFKVGNRDRVEGYLLITTQHILGTRNSVRTTGVRVVCANTMAMAEASGQAGLEYSQDHLSDFDVSAAKGAVEAAHEALAAGARRANTLAKLKLNIDDAIQKVLLPVFAPELAEDPVMRMLIDEETAPRPLDAVLTSVNSGPGADPNTGWGVLNGVTHWADHVAGRSPEARMARAWMGDTAALKIATENKLLELAA